MIKNKKTVKTIAITLIAAVAALLILFGVYGVSRIVLNIKSKDVKTGYFTEYNWSARDVYDPNDESAFYTFDIPKSREFKTLTLTDIHYKNDGFYASGVWVLNAMNKKTDRDIKKLVKETEPDLIIVGGDLETGTLNDLNYKRFATLMDGFGIPWTVVFGNHDAEHRADKAYLMNIMQSKKNCIFKQGPTNIGIFEDDCPESLSDLITYDSLYDPYAGGLGNTVIHLRDPETREIYFAYILMDTGDWRNSALNITAEKRNGKKLFSRAGVGLTNKQIEWYDWVVRGMERYNIDTAGIEKAPVSMFVSHIGMRAYDYAAILSCYENSYGGFYSNDGRYVNNDLPSSTDAEWSRPADRNYIEYDYSMPALSGDGAEAAYNRERLAYNGIEAKYFNAISDFWKLADNTRREAYIKSAGAATLKELVAVIDEGYEIHKNNDLFMKKLYELGSTKYITSGHNHCDGYEVVFDGITFTSIVKTGDIYVDTDWDRGNRGGTLFTVSYENGEVISTGKPYYVRFTDKASKRYPRPVEDF